MDLWPFYAAYRVDGKSRPAYEPAMMVALLLYAYSRGIRSSRVIERACIEDVAFRVVAAQQRPDHATIARFIERHEAALAGLFGEVLLLCARSGLAKVGVIAIDGTKVHANASRDANVDYEQLAREIIEEAKAIDAAEDELYGDGAATSCPRSWPPVRAGGRGCARPSGAWSAERDEQPQPVPRSRPKRVKEAKRRLEEELFTELRANAAYEATARGIGCATADGWARTRRPSPTRRRPRPRGASTPPILTHVSSKALRGFIQGYNAQAVTNEHQIVLAAEVMTAGGDFGHLEPMLEATRRELHTIGVEETPGVVLADAGYWHQQQMERAIGQGTQVLIPPDTSKRKTPRPGWTGGYYAFMRRVLASERGGELYGRRQPMIEPVFGQTKHNRGMGRFHRRGRGAVRAEWRLITATHNLLKLHRHALAAA